MCDYGIRLYKDADCKVVRDLYVSGVLEYRRPAFSMTLRLPHIWIFLLVAFLTPLVVFGSIFISVLAIIFALFAIWLGIKVIFQDYVEEGTLHDLRNINKYYMQRDGHCLWVVESAGQVVGTVAAVPSSYPGGERHIRLKRMSIAKGYRGRGIAKVLCSKVIDFARKRGCEAVILTTSSAHIPALQLYEKMGFRRVRKVYSPKIIKRLLYIDTLFLKYDIPTGN